jgi:tetratricopeptide (TPR) repeat protein
MTPQKDFFISYNKADRQWAEWIAWTLEEAGYWVVIQAWDFRPGGNFGLEMHKATVGTQKTIAVLSEDYLKSAFTQPEWAAAFVQDPEGEQRTLLLIRVGKCRPPGLLASIIYADLVDLPEEIAQDTLLKALLEKRAKPSEKPDFPGSRTRVIAEKAVFPEHIQTPWMVPHNLTQHFTGRDDELKVLRESLLQGSAAALTQPQAISGLGGIGKTQTAVKYAHRHRNDYSAVFWVSADSTLTLSRGFVVIAKALELPQANAQDEEVAVQAALKWLNTHANWLLIFDNADEPELLQSFCPQNAEGHVLVTSRAQDFQDLGITQPVEIKVFLPEEASLFLLERTGRTANSNSDEHAAVEQLAKELGYLPLALEQAAAYVVTQKAQFQAYLDSYRNLKLKRLESAKPKLGNYPESVATTWLLNFRQVKQISEASANLLEFSAFLDPDAIPFELIVLGASQFDETLKQALDGVDKDSLILNELLNPLGRYSLIYVDPHTQTYSIHRLVQEVLRAEMELTTLHNWIEQTIRAANQAFPDPEFKNWPLCERLLSHVIIIASFQAKYACSPTGGGRLFNQAGTYLQHRGQYSSAKTFLLRSRSIIESQLGPNHPDVAQSLNNLATLYQSQGLLAEAESLFLRSFFINQQYLSPDHPNVATSFNNLAELYRMQVNFAAAEPFCQQSLSVREQQLGLNHPYVATSLNNLALIYEAQGRYGEAEQLHLRSLDIRESQLGADHPDVAQSLNNLAEIYRCQGHFQKAEPLHLRSLDIRESQLGTDHPDVAQSLNNLAEIYRYQGHLDKAEPLHERSLCIKKSQLGPNHPDVAASFNNLAELYQSQRRYDEAESFFKRSLEIFERQLGNDHFNMVRILNNLAGFYKSQCRYSEAEPLYLKGLEIAVRKLGEQHHNTIMIRRNFANNYQQMAAQWKELGHHDKVVDLLEKANILRQQ